MAIFVLVHGSMHGGWCWDELVPLLRSRGHRAVAPDLPCDDVGAGLSEYAEAVLARLDADLDARPDGVLDGSARQLLVLVGHSLGSRTIPVVATRRATARMIFLCSVPTGAGAVDAQAFAGMVTAEYAAARFDERGDGARRIDAADARRVFFDACSPAIGERAVAALRWQGPRPLAEAAPIACWPDLPLEIVLARDDRAVRFEWAREEARRWTGGREPVVLPGDHSLFLSCPERLADTLCALVAR